MYQSVRLTLIVEGHKYEEVVKFTETVDHIGIAVRNLDEALRTYVAILGFEFKSRLVSEQQKVNVVFLSAGNTEIELLEPTDTDGPVARFIEKRGEGLHHLALVVDNIEECIEAIRKNGMVLIDKKPRVGAKGEKIAFIHPKSTKGVLIELCEGEKERTST